MMVQKRIVGLVRAAPLPVTATVICALAAMMAGVGQWFFTADVVRKVFIGAAAADLIAPAVTSALLLIARQLSASRWNRGHRCGPRTGGVT